jgi:hypothetical protein
MTAHHDHWHGARSHLYRILGVLLAVLLLVGVFWLIQPINSQEHQRLMSAFDKLQHNEARLG